MLVSHTHWDREWYLPFQQFRAKLVQAVDLLLDLMASNPEYRYFTLDGQIVILEDYLDVRPDREVELRELISSGRVLVGPWYIMPDEFLVSGESLVRNLLEGRRVAARFGPVMNVGYVPDPFGHISQLPQILAGFGIGSAVLWRGIGSDLKHSEAVWEAPDGTSVFLLHMPNGYAGAAVLPASPDALMERIGQIRAQLQPRARTDYLLLMNGDDHMLPQPDVPSAIVEASRRLRDAEVVHGTLPMLLDGARAQLAAERTTLERLRGELRSSELSHLLAGVLSVRIGIKQRNYRCQVLLERWAEPFSTFAGLLPLGLDGGGAGQRENVARQAPGMLRVAWRYLLKNQPHDSICGCSIDQVHAEMETRYDWCEQVGRAITDRALESIASAVDTERLLSGQTSQGAVAVFNSEAGPRTDFVTTTVEMPGDPADLTLADAAGRAVAHQVLSEHLVEIAGGTFSREELQGYMRLSGPGKGWPHWKLKILEKVIRAALRGRAPDLVVATMDVIPGDDPSSVNVDVEATAGREHNYDAISEGMRQLTNLVDRGDAQSFRLRVRRRGQVEIGFVAPDVPAHGMKLLHFRTSAQPARHPAHLHAEATLENEHLSLQVSAEDGTARLIDRGTGAIFWGLNGFADGGDAGDEYTYCPPPRDPEVRQPEQAPTIILEENGPARQVLRVDLSFRLPTGLSEDRFSRSEETVSCAVTSRLAVYPGVPRVDVQTTVINQARDHRLRVLFPTHLNASHSAADGHFAVIERPVAAPASNDGWIERPVTTYPQGHFVDLSDGTSGLMVANRGLPEYDVVELERGPAIAVTLLRCVGWLSRDDLATRQGAAGPMLPTPGAQMLGTHIFEYSIIPHPGRWEQALHQAYWFARPLAARWTGRHHGALPPELSFLAVSPASVVVSAVKQAEDGSGDLVVRVYNTLGTAANCELKLFFPVRSAKLSNLAEETFEELEVGETSSLRFQVGGHRITTLRLTPAST